MAIFHKEGKRFVAYSYVGFCLWWFFFFFGILWIIRLVMARNLGLLWKTKKMLFDRFSTNPRNWAYTQVTCVQMLFGPLFMNLIVWFKKYERLKKIYVIMWNLAANFCVLNTGMCICEWLTLTWRLFWIGYWRRAMFCDYKFIIFGGLVFKK